MEVRLWTSLGQATSTCNDLAGCWEHTNVSSRQHLYLVHDFLYSLELWILKLIFASICLLKKKKIYVLWWSRPKGQMWNSCFVKNVFTLTASASVPWWWSLWGYSGAQRLFSFTPVVCKTALSSVSVADSRFWHGFFEILVVGRLLLSCRETLPSSVFTQVILVCRKFESDGGFTTLG